MTPLYVSARRGVCNILCCDAHRPPHDKPRPPLASRWRVSQVRDASDARPRRQAEPRTHDGAAGVTHPVLSIPRRRRPQPSMARGGGEGAADRGGGGGGPMTDEGGGGYAASNSHGSGTAHGREPPRSTSTCGRSYGFVKSSQPHLASSHAEDSMPASAAYPVLDLSRLKRVSSTKLKPSEKDVSRWLPNPYSGQPQLALRG
jgi:hypothetical protein